MKRWLLFFLILFVLAFSAIYLMIPKEYSISKGVIIHANAMAAGRMLSDNANWQKLWPKNDKTVGGKDSMYLNGFTYRISKKNYNSYNVSLTEEPAYEGSMLFALLSLDSLGIEWRGKLVVGNSPVERIRGYFNAKKIRRNLDDILYALKVYLEDNRNIYGTRIATTKITDSVMISMIKIFKAKPGTEEIYGMINPLKAYVSEKGAVQKNYPMMGNLPSDSNQYRIITAIPIDKSLPERGSFVMKQMLFNGNNISTEVKGGPSAIRNAYTQMNNYILDNQRTLATSPFEFLVTDRLKEPDTSKWVTIINYPVY